MSGFYLSSLFCDEVFVCFFHLVVLCECRIDNVER